MERSNLIVWVMATAPRDGSGFHPRNMHAYDVIFDVKTLIMIIILDLLFTNNKSTLHNFDTVHNTLHVECILQVIIIIRRRS